MRQARRKKQGRTELPSVVYLVCGYADIGPAAENLRRTGRKVRFDTKVSKVALDAMRSSQRYVVVTHGQRNGTLMWCSSEEKTPQPWLWKGMKNAPRPARLYLYSCFGGLSLPSFLKCDAFGHLTEVPMPAEGARGVVLSFLDEVDALMRESEFEFQEWQRRLAGHVNAALAREIENRTTPLAAAALMTLRESLGNFDD